MTTKKGTQLFMDDFIIKNLTLEHTLSAPLFISHNQAHEVLSLISSFIVELGYVLPKDIFYSPSENVWIAKNANVSPTAQICGPCIIDEHAEIRHCAFIRGAVIIGKNAVVGNSSEIKNSILFDGVQVPHYNYVGDSIIGYRSHLGAGAVTSNLKSDRSEVSVSYGGARFLSSKTKLGAIIGDCVEVGCGAVLNPGTVISRNSRIYPLSSVRGYIPENSIYKCTNEIIPILSNN